MPVLRLWSAADCAVPSSYPLPPPPTNKNGMQMQNEFDNVYTQIGNQQGGTDKSLLSGLPAALSAANAPVRRKMYDF